MRIRASTSPAWKLFSRKIVYNHKFIFLTMLTREEITEVYEGDPKALISLIQNLEKRIEKQNIKIAELEKQVQILTSRYSGDFKE